MTSARVPSDSCFSMTPLTHAASGAALYKMLRRSPLGRWSWVVAFPLAFASHYLLDAIPHFEGVGPFILLKYQASFWVFLGLGMIGGGLAVYLFRRNREAGLIWLLLSLWIGLGGISPPALRLPAALACLGYLAYKTKQADAVASLLAGMLAVAPDWVFVLSRDAHLIHHRLHYHLDWATRLYLHFHPPPIPQDWQVRLSNPYFLLGYGLELLVEAVIFFLALYLFSRQRLEGEIQAEEASQTRETVDLREGS